MSFTNPVIADFKAYYVRDFVYGIVPTTVMDDDLDKALARTANQIASACFETQAEYEIGFYLLMAHFLVRNLNAATQGASGGASWQRNSHSVGSVSESFAVPQSILNSPYFSSIAMTNYGQEYLMLIWPKLAGQVFTVGGGSRP